ncbi:ABC transporter ATP-binding protein [Enterococcus timonensis]|uniref:ABC transporter ATP-binding protein n=1 Tax=Enterococcus timonensis TaxID=1852364 RepID=UPI0008DAC9E4|nr:ABC transporter ATP-binding protein [Enterococcus timonensis]
MSLLEVEKLTKNFGGLQAVANVSLKIQRREILGLIGPNGAGKTTLFNLLTGVYAPTEGFIVFDGQNITKSKPNQIANLGVGRTFQNIRLFNQLTVAENIEVALHQQNADLLSEIFRLPLFSQQQKIRQEKVAQLLEFFQLADYANLPANSLAYGLQRRLEIARALASAPKILFLDEPAAGMNPSETKELMDLILKIHDQYQIAIVLIEHDMKLVMNVCQRVCVLEYGRVIKNGTPYEVQNDPRVIAAYLGGDV